MKIVSERIRTPEVDWMIVPKRWISMRDTGLNGGLVFNAALVELEPLFAEFPKGGEVPHLVTLTDGRTGVVSGEVDVLRAMLEGKAGFEAKVYRL